LSWEGFITWRAGQSHFLAQSQVYGSVHLLAKYAYLAWPLVTIMGAVAPALTVLALLTLRASRRTIFIFSAMLCLGYFLIAFVPERYQVLKRDPYTNEARFTLAWVIFSTYGLAFGSALGVALWRVTRLSQGVITLIRHRKRYQAELFLLGWLAIEIVAYFGFSPIPAVRRVWACWSSHDHWPARNAHLPNAPTKIAFSHTRVCRDGAWAALLRCRLS
jgi:hypothetical protein